MLLKFSENNFFCCETISDGKGTDAHTHTNNECSLATQCPAFSFEALLYFLKTRATTIAIKTTTKQAKLFHKIIKKFL